MLVFSKPSIILHTPGIWQILVFSSERMEKLYEERIARLKAEYEVEVVKHPPDIGAIYKLKAIKRENDLWDMVIRCGFTESTLYASLIRYDSSELALSAAKSKLIDLIKNSFGEKEPMSETIVFNETLIFCNKKNKEKNKKNK